MNEILDITKKPVFDESIMKKEYHSYTPYSASYENNDEIRISIQQQDLYLLPCESYIYIEGSLTDPLNVKLDVANSQLNNNCMAFLFDEIRYELNGIEIDRSRNVGFTSTIKNYVSLNDNRSKMLYNSGWSPNAVYKISDGFFNFCVPLNMLLGFAEDYKKIIVNARHDLILIRARTDNNVVNTTKDFKIKISKILWRIPHISVADNERLSLLNTVKDNRSIHICFRSWDLYEYPTLPTESSHHIWTVKTSTQLEKPRFVIFALQTDKNNKKSKDNTSFDHCKLTDVKVHLNSETYPYDDLNIKFDRDQYALLYDMYIKFQQSYYGQQSQPLLKWSEFKSLAPIMVIDCSHQNEIIKTGPVDVRVEFKASENFPTKTTAFCLLLHDRIIEYNALTNEVKKVT